MSDSISIKKGLKIGELDAESDEYMRDKCFIDNGYLNKLKNTELQASIILGRTGSGKTALLLKLLQTVEHAKLIDPNDISITFLENTDIILFCNEIGVKLDLFYRFLWRHVFIIELLKLRYKWNSSSKKQSILNTLYNQFSGDETKKQSWEYFVNWSDKFWVETREQVKQLTTKLSKDIQVMLGAEYAGLELNLGTAKRLSENKRTEIQVLAKQVVSSIQIECLNNVIESLSETQFNDRQKKYFILIDKLDENWAETETRCKFIRALIEETKYMKKLQQVKIVTALRHDLLDVVIDKTRDAGFQEEKYEAFLMPLTWSNENLKELLETRITEIYRHPYTSESVRFADLFPEKPFQRTKLDAFDYIIERTLLRPRDVIQFANECFKEASDRPKISWTAIRQAEIQYSTKRLKSLIEEWSEFYPALGVTLEIMRGVKSPFSRSYITDQVAKIAIELHDCNSTDPCVIAARKLYSDKGSITESDFMSELFLCLYHVGAIGLKISVHESYTWSNINQPRVSKSIIKRASQISIHPMLHHALEIKNPQNLRDS